MLNKNYFQEDFSFAVVVAERTKPKEVPTKKEGKYILIFLIRLGYNLSSIKLFLTQLNLCMPGKQSCSKLLIYFCVRNK